MHLSEGCLADIWLAGASHVTSFTSRHGGRLVLFPGALEGERGHRYLECLPQAPETENSEMNKGIIPVFQSSWRGEQVHSITVWSL